MPIFLKDLFAEWPYLYHVTYSSSLDRIKRHRRLDSAACLMDAGGRNSLLRQRRKTMASFTVEGDVVVLTDQKPIIEANIVFQDGWTLADLIEAINRRVFFWRGSAAGLLKKDQGHFAKYDAVGHSLTFIRLSLEETWRANTGRGPEVCKYNSGAARMNQGRPIPRGLSTFIRPGLADFDIGDVREVVFRDYALLPASTEWCEG